MNLIGINQLKAFQIINVSFYFDDVSLVLINFVKYKNNLNYKIIGSIV